MKRIIYFLVPCLVLIISLIIFSNTYVSAQTNNQEINDIEKTSETVFVESINKFYVDIKGAVKKPGVYLVDEGLIIQNLIELAGGLNKNASTKNINLSKKLVSEMVIYIPTKSEETTKVITTNNNKITNTNCTSNINDNISENTTNDNEIINNEVNNKVNINTATKEELMTLNGIGESKALAIICYREEKLFNVIEDIMNVSGIGESAFDKIKDNITV